MTETFRPPADPPALVGREDECAILAHVIDDSMGGRGAFVLIEGPAGIGKSRLAREAVALAEARGFATLVGMCSRDERGVAYAPIVDAMRDARWREPDPKQAAARRLREVLEGPQLGEGTNVSRSAQQANRARVTDAMLQFLNKATPHGACIVIIEDVHWADHATMRLLNEVSRHTRDTPTTFLLTYRDDEIASNGALLNLLHTLSSTNRNVHSMRLDALTWSQTRTMAQTVLRIGWMPPTAFVDHLYARAEGNPFFTEEILRSLSFAPTGSRVDLSIPNRLPESVSRLLEQRIKRLPGESVRVLTTAAVLGRRFELNTMLTVGDIPERSALKALHHAVDAHLIRDTGDGRTMEFQHALVREAAESLLLSPERKERHRRIADELAARATTSMDSASIAYHYGQAGMTEQVRHHAVAAADDAWRTGAPVEAARWFEEALAAGEACGEDPPESVLRRAAEAFAAARMPKLATDTFERLIERQRARGDVVAEAETLSEFAGMFHGDLERRRELLERALSILEPLGETAELARVYAGLASLFVGASLARPAIDYGRKARDVARRTGARDAEAVAQRSLGTVVAAGGDAPDGFRRLQVSISLAREAHKHTDVYLSSMSLVNAAMRAGDWTVGEATARESIEYALGIGAGSDAGSLMSRLAELHRLTGRVGQAWQEIEEALILLDQDETYIFNTSLLVKGFILADLGRWQEVRELVDPILPDLERSGQFSVHGGALFLVARALHGTGRKAEAIETLERLLEAWRETEDNYYILPVLLFACRLGCEEGDVSAAQRHVAELRSIQADSPLARATLSCADAWLAFAEGRLDDAILQWRDSAQAFEDLRRPIDAGRAHLELGRSLLLRNGADDRKEAKEHLLKVRSADVDLVFPEAEQAEALLRRHRLIATRSADGGPLTTREREIAVLIARGLTNRAIAEDLTLSLRTVDNHVSRMLSKLQLESRSQIVAYAMERGVTAEKPVK